jgi:hypothetical protein
MKTKLTLTKVEINSALEAYVKERMPEHEGRNFKAMRSVNSFTFEISDVDQQDGTPFDEDLSEKEGIY